MLRRGALIGLAVGGLIGYLCSFDISTDLGSAIVPVYVGFAALCGWGVGGFVPRIGDRVADRDQELVAVLARAEAAEAEIGRLKARLVEMERRSSSS